MLTKQKKLEIALLVDFLLEDAYIIKDRNETGSNFIWYSFTSHKYEMSQLIDKISDLFKEYKGWSAESATAKARIINMNKLSVVLTFTQDFGIRDESFETSIKDYLFYKHKYKELLKMSTAIFLIPVIIYILYTI